MEWTREKTLLLISEYRSRRGLWDMTCDEYRKKDVKQRLLNEVSQVLGGNIPVNELEKKFHTLRTQYHREISRMKRKEPYNSKWFGFKNLVFLSSPYACRSTKGRLKADLQGDERKFTVGEVNTENHSERSTPVNNSNSGGNSNSNMNEEYLRKSHASSRAQELEKLIEETTKDVDDIEEQEIDDSESKPKLGKELNVRYVSIGEQEEAEPLENHHHQHQQSLIDMHHSANAMEAVSFQASENGELHYQSAPSQSSTNNSMHVVPTRIIKIQRRDTSCHEDGYFDEHTHHQLHPPTPKRVYFDAGSTPHILTPALENSSNGTANSVLTASPGITMSNLRLPKLNTSPSPKPASAAIPGPPSPTVVSLPSSRDEFVTYGEYVANEMRAIGNREVLIALKHKINTAIFEANMAELQK
ncbi:uncharacterized protein LOC110186403 [Drosophila serrata]|uniref:uncharacterized protein LOC110186403 n=1 Tax=Drosophila serrata TaxID=7274 RepID=UPI000A1D2700|nr:uncharacterized protein LOC110186403 [Drosophila serrata]XP_020811229.1 uncharacterized protein LOC110186403 [Drosophila serrata]KAH8355934.1 hypothetical protein KR200_002976 [Drosophila serrata]